MRSVVCGFVIGALLFALGLSVHGLPARGLAGGTDSHYQLRVPLGLDEYVPIPDENPLTAQKVKLGKQLFFDKRLSRDGTIACASCHLQERALTNGERVAIGIQGRQGLRNVPAIFNRAYGKSFFWDGRASSLEEQALEPIQNPKEMDMTLSDLEIRLFENKEYTEQFQNVFGGKPTAQNAAKAIASFVRTLLSGNSAYDRFEHGEQNALSASAKRGLQIFRGKGNCIACHVGPNFTDEKFHNTGVAFKDTTTSDWGRYAVTKFERDKGAFKTPTLREVSRTAPYMHNGSFASLQEVIDFYNQGGIQNPYLDEEIRPLKLTEQEKEDLIEFLKSLTGEGRQVGTSKP